jgi:hypothetical protein
MNNENKNKEQLCTITEQGSYGLGANEVEDEKEREELKKRLQEQLNQSNN